MYCGLLRFQSLYGLLNSSLFRRAKQQVKTEIQYLAATNLERAQVNKETRT